MSTDDTPQVDDLGDGWVTLAQAAELLGLSDKTVRRKVKTGELSGQMAFDPAIGSTRWMLDSSKLPAAPGAAELIPVELLDRLAEAWTQAREAAAAQARAEQVAEFEKMRRHETETDMFRMRTRIEDLEGRKWWQRRS